MELSCPKILLLRRWRLRRSIEITPPSENFILLLIESAKSFTYLLLCFRCLVSYIFSCSTCLRNFLPNKLSSLPYLVPYVLPCFVDFVLDKLICLMCLKRLTSLVPYVLSLLMLSRVPSVLSCLFCSTRHRLSHVQHTVINLKTGSSHLLLFFWWIFVFFFYLSFFSA